jgi:uncharacterized FAD-dependent dehydrogenase
MVKSYDVIIIGTGPAGIFAALELTRRFSSLKVAMFEKGVSLQDRVCPLQNGAAHCSQCNPCSVISGWGGAGAFSDGKLTLSPEVGGMLDRYLSLGDISSLIKYVDDIFVHFGAPSEVYGKDREEEVEAIRRKAVLAQLKLVPAPVRHMGTGRTQDVLKGMLDELVDYGVEIHYVETVDQILTENGSVKGIRTKNGEEFYASYVVCAPGRDGSEWLAAESKRLGLSTAVNPVDVGVRVEIPAEVMAHITDIVYESKFIFHSRTFDDQVRTFCMNPYGEVVQENTDGLATVNGHTHAERKTDNTNFAILVSKNFTEPFKEPIAYGKYIASLANLLGGGVLVQRLGDLMSGRRTTVDRLAKSIIVPTLKEATPGDLSLVFPYRHLVGIMEMLQALDVVAPGIYSKYTLLYGVEVKFYSSRLEVDKGLETKINNLFGAGDGAGITRGLIQASISGVVAARSIAEKIGRRR